MKLEELARQASTDARTSVSRLDPPPIGEPDRPRWLVPAVAGVAVTALVVGGLAVISRNGGGAEIPAPAATVPEVTDPPRLAFGPGVEGWQAISAMSLDDASAFEQPAEGEGSSPSFAYYGTVGADDPFVAGDLMIGTIGDLDEPASDEGVGIEIRGTTGRLSSDLAEIGIDLAIEWTETDAAGNRLDLVVASRWFDQNELVAIIDGLVVDVAAGTAVAGEDLDLDLLVESNDLPLFSRLSGDGWLVSYIDAAGDGNAYAVLTSAVGSLQESAVTLRWWLSEVENVLVGEMPGLQVTLSAENEIGASRTLVWSPEPGVVAALNVLSGGPDDLIGLAEQVVELTPAEWAALVDETQFPGEGGGSTIGDGEIVADGGGEIDGVPYSWALSASETDLCFDVNTQQSSSGSCGGPEMSVPPRGTARMVMSDSNDTWRIALVVADPAVDDLRPLGDLVTIDRFEWNDASWFVTAGPIDTDDRFEVVVGGDVVDTITVAAEVATEAPTPPVARDELVVEFPVLADAGHADVVFVADGSTDGLRWGIGESVAGLCLYTAGVTDSVSCNEPADVTVFPAVAVDGQAWTFVSVTHRAGCPFNFSSRTSPFIDSSTDGVTSVWIVDGESDGWQIDVVEDRQVDLPANGESIEWPSGTCEP